MAKTYNHILTQTLYPSDASAVIPAKRFVKGDASLCGAGEKSAGVTVVEKTADQKYLSACLVGIAIIEAGASVTAGDECESDANGKAITLATGKSNGVLLDDGAAGDEVRVVVR